MSDKPEIPQKVQAIGLFHLIGGILNIMTGLSFTFIGLIYGVLTFGIGFIMCCPAVYLIVVGILEIMSGAKHLGNDHTGLHPPRGLAIAEICGVAACSMYSLIFGILTLVFLNDPEVEAYYAKHQLPG